MISPLYKHKALFQSWSIYTLKTTTCFPNVLSLFELPMYSSKFSLIFKHFNLTIHTVSVKQKAQENLRTDFNTLNSHYKQFTLEWLNLLCLHVDSATEHELDLLD